MAGNNHQAAPQDDALATYAKKLDKAEAELDWQLPASCLDQKIRAYQPWPVAQITVKEPGKAQSHRVKILAASVSATGNSSAPGTIISADKQGIAVATSEGTLVIEQMQLPGKKPLPVADILNARADWFPVGSRISD